MAGCNKNQVLATLFPLGAQLGKPLKDFYAEALILQSVTELVKQDDQALVFCLEGNGGKEILEDRYQIAFVETKITASNRTLNFTKNPHRLLGISSQVLLQFVESLAGISLPQL